MKKYFNKLSLLLILSLLLTGCGGLGKVDKEMLNSGAASDSYFDGGWNESPSENAPIKDETLTENDLSSRKMIKTVNLTLQTKEFDRLKNNLEELIPSYGGYIQDSNFYDPQREGRFRSYTLTIRIPVDNLDSFISQVGLLGTLTNKSEKIEDVTLTYIDLTAYKEALEVEYDKVLELLEKAYDLDQVLILESKLSQLRYEINSYESKLRAYDNLVAYSTVHIDINEVQYEVVVKDTIANRISSRFMQSLYDVRDFFVNLLVFVVGNLPVLLVLAIFLTIFIFLLKKIIVRKKQRREDKKQAILNRYKESATTPSDPKDNTLK